MSQRFSLVNGFLARTWSFKNGRLTTESMESLMAGKMASVSDRGISLELDRIGPLDGRDFEFSLMKADRKTLQVKLSGKNNPLEITLRYVLNPQDHFLRKFVEIRNAGKKEVTLLRYNNPR